jgi:hypothetical protein
MAMRCPNCSNEISIEETFCGLCGTPVVLSAKPVDPTHQQGLLSSGYYGSSSPVSDTFRTGKLPPTTNQTPMMPPGSQQQYGFHQDPTQAMSVLPPQQVQGHPTQHAQQNFGNPVIVNGYSGTGQFAPQMQTSQSGNFTATLYPTTQTPVKGQGYGMPPGFTPPPPRKRGNTALIILSVCIVLALITILAFGASFFLHNNTTKKEHLSHQNATATTIPTPTMAPSPSPSAAPSPAPSPSPTLMPTSTPDAGFSLCNNICTSNGFSVEYPSAWSQSPTSDSTGTQFTNPSQADNFASFKTPGTTNKNAGQLVNDDLSYFSSQPGYTAPTPTPSSNATIGGENWSYQIAYYQLNGQTTRIEVYATVHQGKAYLIELQAIDSNFEMVNTQYFERMLARFLFQ